MACKANLPTVLPGWLYYLVLVLDVIIVVLFQVFLPVHSES